MDTQILRIAVTGGAGQIAYSLLFRIASGEMFGDKQKIALHILEIPEAVPALEGVKMELVDCSYPLLEEIVIGSDPREVFAGIHWAFLVGAKPRSKGMERKDLLQENGKIFVEQGRALNEVADRNVKVLVVGNPCNTNCLIAMHHAPDLPPQNFVAMTRLDQNRAAYQLSQKAKVPITEIDQLTIWGNHSATQVPDFHNATISEQPVETVITDHTWLETEFIEKVQKRGAEVIQARGKSSAASAANAIIDTVHSLLGKDRNHWFSLCVLSDDCPYEIQPGLIFSFPCRTKADGWVIVPELDWNGFISKKIRETEKELLEERDLVTKFFNVS